MTQQVNNSTRSKEEELLRYYTNSGLGAEGDAPNPSLYVEELDNDDDMPILGKSKGSEDDSKILVDKDDSEDFFGDIFTLLGEDMSDNNIISSSEMKSITEETKSYETDESLDNILSGMITQKSEEDINNLDLDSMLKDNNISTETDTEVESLTEDENVDTMLRKIKDEIESFNPKFNDVAGFQAKDVSKIVQSYLSSSLDSSVKSSNYNLDIRELVKSPFNHESMIKLTKVLNLRENMRLFADETSRVVQQLKNDFDKLHSDNSNKRNEIIKQVENFKVTQVSELNNFYEGESKLLQMKEQKFENEIKKLAPLAVNTALTEHKELFENIDYLKDEVEEIKSKIIGVLGKNFIAIKENKIEIPKTKEELQELIDIINSQLDSLEIKDSSFYKRTISKLMKIIFAPTRYTDGTFRSIVMLVNVLAFLVVAVKFRELFLLVFTSTIMVDLYNQIKLSNRNHNTDLVMEFAVRSDEIVQAMTNEVIMRETRKIEKKSEPVLSLLKDSFKELHNKLNDIFNDKLEGIDLSFNEDEEIDKVEKKYDRIEEAITKEYENMQRNLNDTIRDMEVRLERLMDDAYSEAQKIVNVDIYEEGNNNSTIYNPTYKVGRLTINNGKLGMDLTRKFVEGSYLIQVNSRVDKEEALERVKMLAIQQLTNLRPEHFKVNYIDLEELGNDFMDMLSKEEGLTQSILTEEQLEEHLKKSFHEIGKRYKKATKDFDSVTDFNLHSAEIKEEPFKYELNIFYNIKNEVFRKQQFRTLLTEGGKAGIINVVIYDLNDLYDTRGHKDEETEKCFGYFDFVIKKTNGKWVSDYGNSDEILRGSILPSVENFEREQLEYDRSGIMFKMRNLEEILEANNMDTIYYKDLQERYCPELFQKNTLTGIEICVGFRDGNMDKPEMVQLGDELVHALMGGKTGAGKSNTINVVLMNLLRSYSPEWLELYMVDFKNVEFNFYTETVKTNSYEKKMSKIPHTSLIAGTTDAQYALSVFSKALRDMERRKKILAKGIEHEGEIVTFKKIESYNRFVLKHNLKHKHPIIPRILMLLDEFQVMFQIEDTDVISRIKSMITRLSKEARSMGIHMFFTSQSMSGTLSDDVKGQFAMRWCLSATAETSKELIGNDASSKLKGKGFIYMNGTMERKAEDNQLYKVPFIPEDYITEILEDIRREAERIHNENNLIPLHKQEFYDEEDAHRESELKAYLKHPSISSKRHSVLLGPKVIFREKATPENFTLGHDDGDNVLVMGNDKISLANLVNSLIENFASKERTKIVIANYDKTLDGLINMEHHYTDMNEFIEPNNALSVIETMIDNFIGEEGAPTMSEAERKMAEIFGSDNGDDDSESIPVPPFNPDTDNRYYVFLLGINKSEGFNEDYIDDRYMSPLVNLLKLGPSHGITTIINYRPPFKMSKILPQVNHRISAKTGEDVSFDLFGGRQASRLISNDKTAFGIYKSTVDDREFRFKVYQFNYDKELLKPKELENIII